MLIQLINPQNVMENVLKHLVNLVLKGRAKIDRKPAIFLFQGYVNKEEDDSYRKIRNLYNI